MGLLRIFTGKPPEEMEQIADSYMTAGAYGAAKVEFEKALDKAEKKSPEKEPLIRRLAEKAQKARESLAGAHVREAGELILANEFEAAGDLLDLAWELSGSEARKAEIQEQRERLRNAAAPDTAQENNAGGQNGAPADTAAADAAPEPEAVEDEDAHFHILVNTLSDELQQAYESYGRSFKQGYIALNQGDFQTAVDKFRQAMTEHPSPGTWIPLELATAHMHLYEPEKARETMEAYIRENPESLRGYQLLCDIYWDTGDYDAAVRLLENCPDALKENLMIPMLLGETHYQAGRYAAARDVFSASLRHFGEEELIKRALAKTHEALGEMETARTLYGEMLEGCVSCGARVDPFIKRRYAELSFQAGDSSTRILEMFLSLVQEDPDNRREYYDRIGKLYEAAGNSDEAQRYFAFAG